MNDSSYANRTIRELMQECRTKLGSAPRKWNWRDQFYLRQSYPAWIKRDPLHRLIQDRDVLLAQGHIVLGTIVQANQILFQPGTDSAPAEILWSDDPHIEDDPIRLAHRAREIFSVKGTTPNGPLREIARVITDEYMRSLNYQFPREWHDGEGEHLFMSTVFMWRRHLPHGHIASPWIPLLILPEKSPCAMVLPERFWADGLKGQR